MTRNDDFDQTLAAWLRREAPPQAPDRVLDAALERVAAQSQARGLLSRLEGGTQMGRILRVAAVAAIVAFAAFIGYQFSNLSPDVGTSPSPSPSPSAEASPSQSSLPSASATPSDNPAIAPLVFRLQGGSEGGRFHLVTVLEDGRIITSSEASPLVERRLTAAGVQLLRDELDATGLSFVASADYSPVAKPGVEPPPFGGAGPALEVGLPGGGTAVITWFFFGDTEQDYFQPQPEAEALQILFGRLTTLDEWLPASAWADANARPYAPPQYRVSIRSQKWGGSLADLPVESPAVSWPLIGGIDALGDAVESVAQEPGEGDSTIRCRVLSGEEGSAVMGALEAAGATADPSPPVFPGPTFELGYRATSRVVTIVLEAILPHADASCGVEIPF